MWDAYSSIYGYKAPPTRVSVDKDTLRHVLDILARIPCDDHRCKGASGSGWTECHACAARRKASFLDEKEVT